MNYEGIVRPVVMLVLVTAQVALAALWATGHEGAKDAFSALGAFTMAVIVYLFKSRDEEKRGTAAGATVNVGPGGGGDTGVTVNTAPTPAPAGTVVAVVPPADIPAMPPERGPVAPTG